MTKVQPKKVTMKSRRQLTPDQRKFWGLTEKNESNLILLLDEMIKVYPKYFRRFTMDRCDTRKNGKLLKADRILSVADIAATIISPSTRPEIVYTPTILDHREGQYTLEHFTKNVRTWKFIFSSSWNGRVGLPKGEYNEMQEAIARLHLLLCGKAPTTAAFDYYCSHAASPHAVTAMDLIHLSKKVKK